MRTVSLLRHAKAVPSEVGMRDFDRPLNARGEANSLLMGAFLDENVILPDLFLVSPSVRTRQTLDFLQENLDDKADIVFEDKLFHASSGTIFNLMRSNGGDHRHLMIIGHNPGLHVLALDLIGRAKKQDIKAIARKFPTAALAVIDFPVLGWDEVKLGEGDLRLYAMPKGLQKDHSH